MAESKNPECAGTGTVLLLTGSRACGLCGGAAADAAGKDSGVRVVARDERGRPLEGLSPGGQTITYAYCDAGDSTMPESSEETSWFDFDPARAPVGPLPAPPPASKPPCSECGGSRRVVLLTSSRACARCGGTGVNEPADRKADDFDAVQYFYDREGRLTRTQFGAS